MRRQEQGIRQLIDGSGHVAEDEAGAEPVESPLAKTIFRSFRPDSFRDSRPKPCRQ